MHRQDHRARCLVVGKNQYTSFLQVWVLFVQAMATLTNEQRWDIVKAWKRTHSIAATSRQNGVSEKTARKWVQRYQDTGDVLDKQRPGAKCMLNEAVCAVAMDLMLSPTYGDAATAAEEIFARGLTSRIMHRTSVARQVKKYAKRVGMPI